MATKDTDEKDGVGEKTNEESHRAENDSEDEGEIEAVKPQHGEPADNLKRRSDWFQKRHGGG
jgi:hypothetical protein